MLAILLLSACTSGTPDPLADKTIVIDPGHGGTAEYDQYRVGPAGEREEWVNLRVALLLRDKLEERGARVLLTRTEDVEVALDVRARLAVENDADAFVSVHHNATADPGVNFPIIYYHANASENSASVELAKAMGRRINEYLFDDNAPVSVVSDHAIFPTAGASVLRNSYGFPGVIVEASFFTHPEEEQRLMNPEYNRLEAKAYVRALEDFFSEGHPPPLECYSTIRLPAFPVLQEADRMDPAALLWREDFEKGMALLSEITQPGKQADDPEVPEMKKPEYPAHATGDPETTNLVKDNLEEALKLFERSARSFPDSWLAGRAHAARAEIMELLGEKEKADTIRMRVKEFYVWPDTDIIKD